MVADAVQPISHSQTFRLSMPSESAALDRLREAVAAAGAELGALDTVEVQGDRVIRDVAVRLRDTGHGDELLGAFSRLDSVGVLGTSDRVMDLHQGGKLAIQTKVPVNTREDLAMVYTPGVARVCSAIAENPQLARTYTVKRNTIAVISDGSAVLGLGDIGPA